MGNKNLLFESIFNRKFSDEDIPNFLTQVTQDHPYFSPAQYFLLLQSDKKSNAYTQQVAKTSVLFNNPHWLKFQLDEYERNPANLSNSIISQNDELVFAENPATTYHKYDARTETKNEDVVASFCSFEQELSLTEPEEYIVTKEPAIEVVSTLTELENIAVDETKIQVTEVEQEQTFEEELNYGEDIAVNEKNETQNEVNEVGIEQIVEEEFIQKEVIRFNEENDAQNEVKEIEIEQLVDDVSMYTNNSTVNEENETKIEGDEIALKETAPEIKTALYSGHFNDADSPLVNDDETDEDITTEREEIEPLNFRLNIDISGTTADTISFEPLHATDYFASLGMKLSGDIQPTDKLGKQLKSFTEWLKTMKKIHSDQQAQQNGQAEITIQKLAENSNHQEEVVTESMAAVLLQQGKAKKAIEVYKKLSLLDSSKSAYFAGKIDQLKEQ